MLVLLIMHGMTTLYKCKVVISGPHPWHHHICCCFWGNKVKKTPNPKTPTLFLSLNVMVCILNVWTLFQSSQCFKDLSPTITVFSAFITSLKQLFSHLRPHANQAATITMVTDCLKLVKDENYFVRFQFRYIPQRLPAPVAAVGFLSRYLNGPLPYVWHHITINKRCWVCR